MAGIESEVQESWRVGLRKRPGPGTSSFGIKFLNMGFF
jgi:hypothetical protein